MLSQTMPNKLKNKTIIITGGAGGLALSLINQLLAIGANIAALDLNIDSLKPSNQLLPIKVDITDDHAVNRAINNIVDHYGQIDILINNAGITHMSKFEDTSTELFNTIMAVNFTASVNITRSCLPYLIKTGGQIVAISSVAGFAPLYGRCAYSASKHAMEGFFQSLASEIKPQGVSVLVVCPSFVKSRPELDAQVNGGISSPGATKKNTIGEQLSPEFAAKKIICAINTRKTILYLGKVSKIAHWLHMLCPSFYLKIMTKNARKEFER